MLLILRKVKKRTGTEARRRWLSSFLIGILILTAGVARYRLGQKTLPDNIANFASPSVVEVEGTIQGEPTFKRHSVRFILNCRKLKKDGPRRRVSGRLEVNFHGQVNAVKKQLSCGNRIRIRGKVSLPRRRGNPGERSRRETLAARSIGAETRVYRSSNLILPAETKSWSPRCLALRLKDRLQKIIRASLPSPAGHPGSIQSVLLEALMLGEKTALPFQISQNFRRTGVIHILVVSGLHVGFIWLLGNLIFSPFSIRIRHALIIPLVAGYVLLTGAQTAAVRAGVMASIYSLAYVFNQPRNTFAALAASALILLLINPLTLFTPGFQLSFLIVLSIMTVNPLLVRKLGFLPSALRRWVSVPIAAQLGAFPLIAHYFHSFPPLALFTNILTVPLAALIVGLGFTAVLFGLLSPFLAFIFNYPNRFFILLLLKLVGAVGRLPFSAIRISYLPAAWIGTWYLLLFSAAHYRFFLKKWKLIPIVLLLAAAGWGAGYLGGEDLEPLRAYFFNSESGDFTLLRGEEIPTILIAPDDDPFADVETIIRPFLDSLRIDRIDYLLLTRCGIDHLNVVRKLLETVRIQTVLDHPEGPESVTFRQFRRLLSENGVGYRRLTWKDIITDGNIAITVLWPRTRRGRISAEARSLIFRLDFREISFLFPSRAGIPAQEELAAGILNPRADILKLPSRGSRAHVSIPFLKKVKPAIGLIVQGKKYFGRYPLDVGKTLTEMGAEVHRTGEEGCLIVDSDGRTIRVSGFIQNKD